MLLAFIPVVLLQGWVRGPASVPVRHAPSAPVAATRGSHARHGTVSVLSAREARLHLVARKAIKRGEHHDALCCYNRACDCPECGSAFSFLLCALHLQRIGEHDKARKTFEQGVLRHRQDAKLVQAWGLFESKHGASRRALMLLKRAVALDASNERVLRWRRFRPPSMLEAVDEREPPPPPPPPLRVPEQPTSTTSRGLMAAARPAVAYTVPQAPRCWRGRAHLGEDPSSWYDAEGSRKGPTPNYWRQAMDERLHAKSMEAVERLLSLAGDEATDETAAAPGLDESTLRELEQRMPLRQPFLNRKLLGRWALIVSDGAAVGAVGRAPPTDAPASESPPQFLAAAMLELKREGGRKTEDHRYGTFDLHLNANEPLLLTVLAPPPPSSSGVGGVEAAAARSVARLGAGAKGLREGGVQTEGDEAAAMDALALLGGAAGLPFRGRITYLNEYLLVTRDELGGLRDVLVRMEAVARL